MIQDELVASVEFDTGFSIDTFRIQIGAELTLGTSPIASGLA